jgi:flavin reductase (DIM6/NTAB) family NADH-FMN oxidoreductase RutF
MAAEWTFNVSYRPFLIMVSVDPANRTHDMILESKEFGVNLVSEEQLAAMAFAGHYSKADTDKLSSEVFDTYPAKTIHAPMIRGALLNAECRLLESHVTGDHTAFIGEVLEFSVDPEKRPVVLHHGSRYLGERIARASGIVLAATPMRAAGGASITVAGELTGPGRAGGAVVVRWLSQDGSVALESSTRADMDGSFKVRLEVPRGLRPGPTMLEAQAGELRGHARVDVG